MSADKTFAVIFLSAAVVVGLYSVFSSWVKPWIVDRANWPFEPGPDAAVSWREMWRRSRWRYDSWYDRIASLFVLGVGAVLLFFVVTGH